MCLLLAREKINYEAYLKQLFYLDYLQQDSNMFSCKRPKLLQAPTQR